MMLPTRIFLPEKAWVLNFQPLYVQTPFIVANFFTRLVFATGFVTYSLLEP